MKKILVNQSGVTLIETVVAAAIIAIIMITVLGALLYGQKMIVFTDSRNNEAAQAQELIDTIVTQLSSGKKVEELLTDGANVNGSFVDPTAITNPPTPGDPQKQYYAVPVDINGNPVSVATAIGYRVYVRVYFNNNQSYVELTAFSQKRRGGDWI